MYIYIHTCGVRAQRALIQLALIIRSHVHIWEKESCFYLFSGFVARISEAKRSNVYSVWVYDRVVIVLLLFLSGIEFWTNTLCSLDLLTDEYSGVLNENDETI